MTREQWAQLEQRQARTLARVARSQELVEQTDALLRAVLARIERCR